MSWKRRGDIDPVRWKPAWLVIACREFQIAEWLPVVLNLIAAGRCRHRWLIDSSSEYTRFWLRNQAGWSGRCGRSAQPSGVAFDLANIDQAVVRAGITV